MHDVRKRDLCGEWNEMSVELDDKLTTDDWADFFFTEATSVLSVILIRLALLGDLGGISSLVGGCWRVYVAKKCRTT